MPTTDPLGNPVTLDTGSVAGPALSDFVLGFIASEARALNVLAAAEHDASPLVQAYAGAVHLFAESREAPANAQPFIGRALETVARATPRERRFIAAVAAWAAGDVAHAITLHDEQAREHPRDLVSLKLGQYHLFNRGDSQCMLHLASSCARAATDVPYFHGMLAFAQEQCHQLDAAEASARRAIALERKEPWAHHALAHVMLTQGRHAEGHDFMHEMSDTWVGLNSFMLTHNWWHQALFALALDRQDEALALYDTRVWGVAKDYTQDQINAISLLARLELQGTDVGQRWQELAGWLLARTQDQVLPFLDVQYLYGLARAGRPEADTLMRNIEQHTQHATGHDASVWRDVALPVARGMLAHACGEHATAASELAHALPRLEAIGGSHAQRELFALVLRDAQWRATHHA